MSAVRNGAHDLRRVSGGVPRVQLQLVTVAGRPWLAAANERGPCMLTAADADAWDDDDWEYPVVITYGDRLWRWWGLTFHHGDTAALIRADAAADLALPDGYALQRSELWTAMWGANERAPAARSGGER